MRGPIANAFRSLLEIDPTERLKVWFLGSSFFFIIFSYTVIKELKDSIFMSIIGDKAYVPAAKLLTIFVLIPIVFFYSKLVDKMRRYQLLCFCAAMYSLVGITFTYLLGHPTLGLSSTVVGPHRIIGWLFYFYVESFTPFVLSVFWAFLNSITDPQQAKKNYGILVAFSKLGGMLSAGLGWAFLYYSTWFYTQGFTDTSMIQMLLGISSLGLLFMPLIIWRMIKVVPGQYLHGYEAAYQLEKQQSKAGKEQTGMWSGLLMLIKYPYTFGIFGLVLFYEVVSSVLSYQRLGMAQKMSCGVAGVSCFLLGLSFAVHMTGFFISLFGTRALVTKLGERLSLILIPVSTGTLLFYYLYSTSPYSLLVSFVVVRAIYYALTQPINEALYIPTVKAIKFKSKSWIDTFGKKMAKGVGYGLNGIMAFFGEAWFHVMHVGLFGLVLGIWVIVAYLLGKKFDRAVSHQEVIGAEEYK